MKNYREELRDIGITADRSGNTKEYIITSKKYGKKIVLLDSDTYDNIIKNKFKLHLMWNRCIKGFYVQFWMNRKKILLHRYIMNCPHDMVVDHINHNTLDNRKSNLKVVTQRENLMNNKRNKSGKAGVCWHKNKNKFIASITVNNKMIHLGYSADINVAIKLREDAEEKYLRGKNNNV